jgi:Spy/CpxP family protein refolding chaperone
MKIVNRSIMILGVAGMLFAMSPGEGCEKVCVPKDGGKNFKDSGMMHNKMFKELDLSKDQQAKIKEIMKKHKPEGKDKGECPNIMDSRKALMDELDSDKPSEQKIKELKKEIISIQEKKLDEMITMKKEMDSVLTKEQIKKLKELKAKRMDKEHKAGNKMMMKDGKM